MPDQKSCSSWVTVASPICIWRSTGHCLLCAARRVYPKRGRAAVEIDEKPRPDAPQVAALLVEPQPCAMAHASCRGNRALVLGRQPDRLRLHLRHFRVALEAAVQRRQQTNVELVGFTWAEAGSGPTVYPRARSSKASANACSAATVSSSVCVASSSPHSTTCKPTMNGTDGMLVCGSLSVGSEFMNCSAAFICCAG